MFQFIRRQQHGCNRKKRRRRNHGFQRRLCGDFPAEELSLEISSVVMERFGEAIEKAVREQLAECGVEKALVRVTDRGALDCVIKARVETAVRRGEAEK